MSLRLFTAFCLGVLLSPYSSALDEPATPAAEQHASATFPAVELQPLLQRVAETAKKRFLVDSRVPAMVTIGTVDPKAVSYSMLLTILRNNGLAAFTQEGLVNIVPVEAIRSLPVPTIQHNDDSIPNDEWVTRVVQIQYISAVQLVPILRQMCRRRASSLPYRSGTRWFSRILTRIADEFSM